MLSSCYDWTGRLSEPARRGLWGCSFSEPDACGITATLADVFGSETIRQSATMFTWCTRPWCDRDGLHQGALNETRELCGLAEI